MYLKWRSVEGRLYVRKRAAAEEGVDVPQETRDILAGHPRVLQVLLKLNLGHAEAPTFFDRYRVGFDFGGAINVVEAFVPEIESFADLAQVSELVEQVQVEVSVTPSPKVAFGDDNPRSLDDDERVSTTAAHKDAGVSKKTVAAPGIRGNPSERRAPADVWHQRQVRVLARRERAMHARVCWKRDHRRWLDPNLSRRVRTRSCTPGRTRSSIDAGERGRCLASIGVAGTAR
jgi:hypothetical protein